MWPQFSGKQGGLIRGGLYCNGSYSSEQPININNNYGFLKRHKYNVNDLLIGATSPRET